MIPGLIVGRNHAIQRPVHAVKQEESVIQKYVDHVIAGKCMVYKD
jgi:hypothetical protein